MPIDKSKLTKEMLVKAAKCKTADELIALAKKEGFKITKNEAEAYLNELQNVELDHISALVRDLCLIVERHFPAVSRHPDGDASRDIEHGRLVRDRSVRDI